MSDSSDTRFSYTGLEKPNVANVGMSTPLDSNSPFESQVSFKNENLFKVSYFLLKVLLTLETTKMN